jgi:hypothetical protein
VERSRGEKRRRRKEEEVRGEGVLDVLESSSVCRLCHLPVVSATSCIALHAVYV